MTPTKPAYDPRHRRLVDAKFSGYLVDSKSPARHHLPGLAHRFFCHSVILMFLATNASTFGNHVSGVVGRRTKKKVLWINAGRVVASVKHAQPRIETSMMNRVRNAMGKGGPMGQCPTLDHSISVGVFVSQPLPTELSLDNVLPESFFESPCDGKLTMIGSHLKPPMFRVPRPEPHQRRRGLLVEIV